LIPDGLDVTVPPPEPPFDTVSVRSAGAKEAFTELLLPPIVMVHEPVPEQAPDQPVNLESLSGFALNVTVWPSSNLAEQVLPQLIRVGLEVTIPSPVPLFVTARVRNGGPIAMLKVRSAFDRIPFLSIARTTKVHFPVAVGVPTMRPSVRSANPEGTFPFPGTLYQLSGAVPPEAAREAS
jgi:hypothetical protein